MATPPDTLWIALLVERLEDRCFNSLNAVSASNVLAVTRTYLAEVANLPPARIPIDRATHALDILLRDGVLLLAQGRCMLTREGKARRKVLRKTRVANRAAAVAQLRTLALPREDEHAPSSQPGTLRVEILQTSREAAGWLLSTIVRDVTPDRGAYTRADLRTTFIATLPQLFTKTASVVTRADADAAIRTLEEARYIVAQGEHAFVFTRLGSDLAEHFGRTQYRPDEDEEPAEANPPPKPPPRKKQTQLSLRRAVVAVLQDIRLAEQLFVRLTRETTVNYEGNYDAMDLRMTLRTIGPQILLVETTPIIVSEVLRHFASSRGWLEAIVVRERIESYRLTPSGSAVVDSEVRTGT